MSSREFSGWTILKAKKGTPSLGKKHKGRMFWMDTGQAKALVNPSTKPEDVPNVVLDLYNWLQENFSKM